jgi:ribose-phosphate pyrophosphokinase
MKTKVLKFSKSIYVPHELLLKYNRFKCTSGEEHIEIEKCNDKPNRLIIAANMMDNNDFISTMLATNVLMENCPKTQIELLSPYLPYTYKGRPSKYGTTRMNLSIIPGLINYIGYSKIHIMSPFDPPDIMGCINPIKAMNNINIMNDEPFIRQAVNFIKEIYGDDIGLISADITVNKRTFKLSQTLNLPELPICRAIDCSTNETLIEDILEITNKNCIIIADTCCSGDTISKLAQELKQKGATYVHLIVTHGIFSNGITHLIQNGIDTIHTTDSCHNEIIQNGPLTGAYVYHIHEINNVFSNEWHKHDNEDDNQRYD